LIDGGVVAWLQPDENSFVGGDRKAFENRVQDPWSQLGGSTSRGGEPGQPDALVFGHVHLLPVTQLRT
jgi:hypothetical protein